jgi:hypothetical protein
MNSPNNIVYLWTLVTLHMRTRILCLPLVILAALFGKTTVFAQGVAHSPLFAYLQNMPAAPAFPDDPTLQSTPPVHFEDHADLNALQQNLESIVSGGSHTATNQVSELELAQIQSAPVETIHADESMSLKRIGDSMLMKLKDVQAVRVEFEENFGRLENIYNKNIDKVNESARKLQREKPCEGNTDCIKEHFRSLNTGIINATREKITSEEYLLSVYLERVKPSFKSVDDLLAGNSYGDGIRSKEVKDLFRSAQHNELQLLNDIIERLKLERITISNCARLAQQYQ